MKLLITGFDPFGGQSINPAWQAVSALPDQLSHIQIIKRQLPTVFRQSVQTLFTHIDQHQPDTVICVGMAGGRYEISLERIAINLDDARIPDNAGQQPIDTDIFADGDNAYFTTLPIKAIVMKLKQAGIPAAVSNTAGTFVCNHIMYSLLYYIKKQQLITRGGFIHIPYLPEQIVDLPNTPYMELSRVIEGLKIAIETTACYLQDLKITGGNEC